MEKAGKVVAVLDEAEYRKIVGAIARYLPRHVGIEIKRKREEKKIELWSRNPAVLKKALEKARAKEAK